MLEEVLTRNLFSMGDVLEITPLDGRRKKIEINRTRYLVNLIVGAQEVMRGTSFQLRGMKARGSFTIERTSFYGQESLRFTSLDEMPFLHNGNVSYQCILRRGDIIDLEHYRFSLLGKPARSRKKDEVECGGLKKWPRDSFICLEGETGTGKTSLARKLHDYHCGAEQPFVAINLSAYNENLIESEIFGHEKGAFTGAIREKRGAIEMAREGTLFIDELDSLPMYLQVKILTFLDDMLFRRVGGEQEKRGRCRLIFSTGQSLKQLVKKGKFRQDLYYRVTSGLNLKLTPLRQKKQVILNVIRECEENHGVTFHPTLIRYLEDYPWPGNYRELKSHLQRKIILSQGKPLIQIGAEEEFLEQGDIDFYTRNEEEIIPLEKLRINYCREVFLKSNGSYEVACKRLGISKSTLKRVLSCP